MSFGSEFQTAVMQLVVRAIVWHKCSWSKFLSTQKSLICL